MSSEKRRSKGDGNVKRMANGKWKVRLSFVDAAGKRHQPTAYFDTKGEALR